VYPDNHLVKVRRREESGSSKKPMFTSSASDSTRLYFRDKTLLLCPECLSRYRSRRRLGCALTIAAVVVLGGHIAGISKTQSAESVRKDAETHVSEAAPASPPMIETTVVDDGQPEPAPEAALDHTAAEKDHEAPKIIEQVDSGTLSADPEAQAKGNAEAEAPLQPLPNALQSAMNEAARTGTPIRWAADGLKGYAVPSVEASSANCRSAYYNIDSRGSGWHSPIDQICPNQ
jgi:hypothetical protein